MAKARDSAIANLNSRRREVEALKARVRMRGDEIDSLKRSESTNCNMEVTTRKVVNTQADVTNLVMGLHRDIVISYDFIRRSVHGA